MSIADFLPLYLFGAACGLIISLCTEQSQIVAKVRSAQRGKIAAGYNMAMKIMIVNRFGTIIYMFLIALSIDIGIENQAVLNVALVAGAGVMCYNLILILARRRLLDVKVIPDTKESWIGFLTEGGIKYTVASFAATMLNVLGLTLPLLLSNSIPEYRLSMANTGFLLNTFFTLINVLLLESHMARLLDKNAKHEAYVFATKVFIARMAAVLASCGVLGILSYIL